MLNKLKTLGTVIFVSLLYCCIFGILFNPLNETNAVSLGSISDGVSLPIITYHDVLKETELTGKYVITPETLESDIEYLDDNGYEFISAEDLIDYTNGGFLPEKPILLIFDDGLYSSYSHAVPVLEKCGARGVVSVIGSYTDEYSESKIADPIHGYLRWTEIYDMFLSSRTEIANQSYDLKSDNFYEDTKKAQERFLAKTGFAPVIYTYPPDAEIDKTTDILKEMGFKMSLTNDEGSNIISKNPDSLFMLRRYTRTSDISTEDFFKKIISQ